ncbi:MULTISPECIES: hypothetical protein [Serratia]|uniref:hypothetical protein n=1 Tax=Serratia TaxID=613 RepID=UPI0021B83F88|nr:MULTISPECIES: hypothetical protein [Serratia]
MTAKLTQSTCTVDVDAANGTYLLSSTRASDIWGATGSGYIQPDLTKITVKLSQCGMGDAGKVPVVTLTGPKAETAYLKQPNGFTFRDAGTGGGTAREFFIGISKTNKPTKWDGNNFYQNLDPIKFSTTVGKGESGEGATATVWAGVASGIPGTHSDKSKARAGTVTATLTFTMAYQ